MICQQPNHNPTDGETANLSPIAENAGNYTNEVLFIAGECNTFIGAVFQREQMNIFPQAQLVIIPDAGHEMIGDNPVDSLAAIQTYFDATRTFAAPQAGGLGG
ncbi:MAG: alpha/beta hydrolase [Chloroflexota bacterium]